jgi:hypothetical protein
VLGLSSEQLKTPPPTETPYSSPSKGTRSHTSASDPVIIVSPQKRRSGDKTSSHNSDLDIWEKSDEEIIGMIVARQPILQYQ